MSYVKEYTKAAVNMDWDQVVLNGGPPCFHYESGEFCGRAQRWDGHSDFHKFVSLADLLYKVSFGREMMEHSNAIYMEPKKTENGFKMMCVCSKPTVVNFKKKSLGNGKAIFATTVEQLATEGDNTGLRDLQIQAMRDGMRVL